MRGISIEFEKTPPHQPLLHVSASPTVRIRISPIVARKYRVQKKAGFSAEGRDRV